ncbi:MAG: hypothetical protein ACYSR5_05365 [Planctomycetota bacterium]|jgi:hypothetical protein
MNIVKKSRLVDESRKGSRDGQISLTKGSCKVNLGYVVDAELGRKR